MDRPPTTDDAATASETPASPESAFEPSAAESPAAETATAESGEPTLHQPTPREQVAAEMVDRFRSLPPYARTLLRIQVPVMVTLATKRQTVGEILQIGPGSILQFEKPCDEALDMEVGDQKIAQGEAVKIGDRFGLRISSIVLPEERFEAVGGVER